MASAIDIGGTLYRSQYEASGGPEDDALALAADWEAVAGDLRRAFGEVEGEHERQND